MTDHFRIAVAALFSFGVAAILAGEPTIKPSLSSDRFASLQQLIKPKPGGYDDVNWMTDLWEARKKAAAEGKPLLVWVGDGHPLGWT